MADRYSCPMCNGEGKVSVRTFAEDEYAPWRLLGYAVIVFALLTGGAILYKTTTPDGPSALQQCAAGCGAGHFKYTDGTEYWIEHIKGSDPDIQHPPVPAKCECVQ